MLHQLEEINYRNEQKNVIAYAHIIGQHLAIISIEDIIPAERDHLSVFITVKYRGVVVVASAMVCPDCILFPAFSFPHEIYMPLLHKIILLHAAALGLKYGVDCILFLVDCKDLSYAMNLPFWAYQYKKSSGSGPNRKHTFAADLDKIFGMVKRVPFR